MNRKNQFVQEYIKLCEEFGYFISTDEYGYTGIFNIVDDSFIYDDIKFDLEAYLGITDYGC